MQLWVHSHQRRLKEYIEDAKEWAAARDASAADAEPDWGLVCRIARTRCCDGDACAYARMAAEFFEKNADSICVEDLAAALRTVIVAGPSKTRLTPMILGPSNTGKSTLVEPFDAVFGADRVFHKPALKSNYALRNILKDKTCSGRGTATPLPPSNFPFLPGNRAPAAGKRAVALPARDGGVRCGGWARPLRAR